MILIRVILIGLIIYLIVRSFTRYADGAGPTTNKDGQKINGKKETKKVSKEIGEYIDYEEVKNRNRQ
jgi:hypothetical protein